MITRYRFILKREHTRLEFEGDQQAVRDLHRILHFQPQESKLNNFPEGGYYAYLRGKWRSKSELEALRYCSSNYSAPDISLFVFRARSEGGGSSSLESVLEALESVVQTMREDHTVLSQEKSATVLSDRVVDVCDGFALRYAITLSPFTLDNENWFAQAHPHFLLHQTDHETLSPVEKGLDNLGPEAQALVKDQVSLETSDHLARVRGLLRRGPFMPQDDFGGGRLLDRQRSSGFPVASSPYG